MTLLVVNVSAYRSYPRTECVTSLKFCIINCALTSGSCLKNGKLPLVICLRRSTQWVWVRIKVGGVDIHSVADGPMHPSFPVLVVLFRP